METSTIEILVFKTNLSNEKQLAQLGAVLDQNSEVETWNVDLQDCDKVLRVVSRGIAAEDVIRRMSSIGFTCEELKD